MYGPRRANDGYRARIGLVVPSVNTVCEAWFPKVVPDGVTIHTGRMPISNSTSPEALAEMERHEISATKLVADCEPDVIMYTCTLSTMMRGRAADLELNERLTRETGVPCCTTTEAIARALSTLNARRICIASPYRSDIDEKEKAFFEECGHTVTGVKGLNINDSRELADPSPGEIYRFARSVWVPGSDAMLLTCLAFRAHFIAGILERDLGVPVVTSATATLWAALQIAGVAEPISGYGRLLEGTAR
jgi:maleate isomerase